MAFVDSSSDPLNNQQQQAPGQPMTSTGTSSSSAPGSVATGQGGGVAAQPNASKQPAVQDLGAYLTANAPQVQQMGQNVANQITQTGQQAQGMADQTSKAFNDAVNANNVSLDQGMLTGASSNPATFAKDPTNVANFQKQLNANYQGPTDFTQQFGYNDANTAIQNAVQTAQSASNPGGLQNLVSSQEVNPTQGVRTLDATLLQQDPTAQATVASAAKPWLNMGDYLTNLTTQNNAAAQSAQGNTAATAKAVQDAFLGKQGIAPTFQSGITKAVQDANKARDAYNANLQSNQSAAQTQKQNFNSVLSDAQNKVKNGVTNTGNAASDAAEQAKVLSYLDGSPYLSKFDPFINAAPIAGAATAGNVANADQYAEDQALSSLLGTGYSPVLDQAGKSQAGSFNVPGALGALPDVSGEQQYIGDITNLFTTPNASFTQAGNYQNMSPQQIAQALLNLSNTSGSGVQPTPEDLASIQRLIANSYQGR